MMLVSGRGQLQLDYPQGFDSHNSIILSATADNYGFFCTLGNGVLGVNASLELNNIFVELIKTGSISISTNIDVKIVLMKV